MNIIPYHFSQTQAPASILNRIHQNDGIFSAISLLTRQKKCNFCKKLFCIPVLHYFSIFLNTEWMLISQKFKEVLFAYFCQRLLVHSVEITEIFSHAFLAKFSWEYVNGVNGTNSL